MRSQNWKYRAAKLMILGLLTTVNFFMITNIITLPQTPSVESQCTDVEIQRHIQQLNKGETADFDALVACKSKAVPALIKALDENKDENFRIITIAVLGDIDAEAAPAVPVLNGLLKDKKENIRIVVVYALEQIGKDAVPSLIIALKDTNNDVRAGAAYALGKIGADAISAVPALITARKDRGSNDRVRADVGLALREIREDYADKCIISRRCPIPRSDAPVVRKRTTAYLSNNTPFMCKISIIKALLRWKCP